MSACAMCVFIVLHLWGLMRLRQAKEEMAELKNIIAPFRALIFSWFPIFIPTKPTAFLVLFPGTLHQESHQESKCTFSIKLGQGIIHSHSFRLYLIRFVCCSSPTPTNPRSPPPKPSKAKPSSKALHDFLKTALDLPFLDCLALVIPLDAPPDGHFHFYPEFSN